MPSLRDARWGHLALASVLGVGAGWLLGSSIAWALTGAVVGLGIAVMIVWFDVRPIVAAPVGIGAGIGAYLGSTIVGVICEPAGCVAFEATAALTTGLGALAGIGLVVALATRSFDEYQEAQQRGVAPPTSTCSPDDKPEGSD